MKRRIVSLWFPKLATDRTLRRHGLESAARPLAATVESGSRILLAGINRAAEEAGLAPGMTLADARAVAAHLTTVPADTKAEAAMLARLGRWCGRYTPLVARDGADGLFLDVTGCAHLFGGEAAMLRDMAGRLGGLGFAVTAALADSAGAAWALSRYAVPNMVIPPGGTARALERLPVAALRLDRESTAGLAHLGLRRIGDLYGLPRGSLAARFGKQTVRRLDQALGHAAEPLESLRESGLPRARIGFAEPIGTRADIDAALGHLLDELCRRLERTGNGARRLYLIFHRVDSMVQTIVIGTARPLCDGVALARLFRDRLDGVDPGFGIEAMELSAPAIEPLASAQAGLQAITGEPAESDGAAALIERLGNRFGFAAVRRVTPVDSHLPDRSWRATPATETRNAEASRPAPPLRPTRLLRWPELIQPEAEQSPPMRTGLEDPPAAFRWRGRRHVLRAAHGPERIAPEWWRADAAWTSGPRDYWRVEDMDGRRFWLCRPTSPTAPPTNGNWYLHGLFG